LQNPTYFFRQFNLNRKQIAGWLIIPAVCLVIQGSAVLYQYNRILEAGATDSQVSIPSGPAVLGASTDLRGEQLSDSQPPVLEGKIFDVDKVSAKSFLVYDVASGVVIAERSSEEKLAVASLTKLLTGLLAYEYLDFTQSIKIQNPSVIIVNPTAGFAKGDEVRIEDIFNAMIVGSTNDCAYILAQEISKVTGKNFVDLMNQKAKQLGMSSSNFSNPMGFDSIYNYSSAEDLRKLVTYTQQFGVFTNLSRVVTYGFKGGLDYEYKISATNKLLSKYKDMEAIKTGYTESSQGAMITKVSNNGHKVVIIVLGSQNREKDTVLLKENVADLLEWR